MEELAQQIVPHPWVLLLLAPFIVIFLWAAREEFRRWWRFGPSENQRADFPMDTDAPGYDPPPEAETTDTNPKEGPDHDHN